jgi:hypothetical protein
MGVNDIYGIACANSELVLELPLSMIAKFLEVDELKTDLGI